MTDEARYAAARAVLTDTEYLTWALAEKGISRQAIAYYRRVSKGTVNGCLAEADRKIEEAMHGKDQEARGEPEEGGQANHRAVQGGQG